MNMFNSYNNKNYLLTRKHAYENEGRFQNEQESLEVRKQIMDELNKLNIIYSTTTSKSEDCEEIFKEIIKEIESHEQ